MNSAVSPFAAHLAVFMFSGARASAVWEGASVLLGREARIGSILISNDENLFQKNENIWCLWEFKNLFESVLGYPHGFEIPQITQGASGPGISPCCFYGRTILGN